MRLRTGLGVVPEAFCRRFEDLAEGLAGDFAGALAGLEHVIVFS